MRSSWFTSAMRSKRRQPNPVLSGRRSGRRRCRRWCCLRFARAVADDAGVAGASWPSRWRRRFRSGADLVDLDQDGVGDALSMPSFGMAWCWSRTGRHRRSGPWRQAVGQQLPAIPVAFRHAVFDGDDGVLVDQVARHVGPLPAVSSGPSPSSTYLPSCRTRWRRSPGRMAICPPGVAGLLDGLQDQLDALLRGSRRWGKAAFVAHGGRHALSCRIFLRAWNTSAPSAGPRGSSGRRRA